MQRAAILAAVLLFCAGISMSKAAETATVPGDTGDMDFFVIGDF